MAFKGGARRGFSSAIRVQPDKTPKRRKSIRITLVMVITESEIVPIHVGSHDGMYFEAVRQTGRSLAGRMDRLRFLERRTPITRYRQIPRASD